MEELNEAVKPKKNSLINNLIKVVLPLVLGTAIVYYLISKIDINQLWDILKEANWPILLSSLVFGLIANIVRAYRANLLLKPLGYTPKISNVVYAILGGYAINVGIPRAGEIWRCGILAKEEKIPFPKLFGTLVLERIFDMIVVVLLVLIAFLFNMQFFVSQLEAKGQGELDVIVGILKSPVLYIAILAAVITTYIVLKYFKENIIIVKIKNVVKSMVKDMKTIWSMKAKGRIILYSILIWSIYFIYFYITFFAFHFTANLGFTAGLIAFALSSLSMGVPSNGGLGPWHLAIIAALTLYGVDELHATAYATGVFAIQAVWVIFCGLFGIAMLSFRKSK